MELPVRSLVAAIGLIAALMLPVAAEERYDTFLPILQDGADPWVLRTADGRYLSCVTTGGDVTLMRASTITGISAAERKVVWVPSDGSEALRDVWAPEIHLLDVFPCEGSR